MIDFLLLALLQIDYIEFTKGRRLSSTPVRISKSDRMKTNMAKSPVLVDQFTYQIHQNKMFKKLVLQLKYYIIQLSNCYSLCHAMFGELWVNDWKGKWKQMKVEKKIEK